MKKEKLNEYINEVISMGDKWGVKDFDIILNEIKNYISTYQPQVIKEIDTWEIVTNTNLTKEEKEKLLLKNQESTPIEIKLNDLRFEINQEKDLALAKIVKLVEIISKIIRNLIK